MQILGVRLKSKSGDRHDSRMARISEQGDFRISCVVGESFSVEVVCPSAPWSVASERVVVSAGSFCIVRATAGDAEVCWRGLGDWGATEGEPQRLRIDSVSGAQKWVIPGHRQDSGEYSVRSLVAGEFQVSVEQGQRSKLVGRVNLVARSVNQ